MLRANVDTKEFAYVYCALNVTRILFDVNRFSLAIHAIVRLHLQISFDNVSASIQVWAEENTRKFPFAVERFRFNGIQ